MKKWVFMLCLAALSSSLYAQNHLFEVKRLPNWGKEYLTIVKDYFYTLETRDEHLLQFYTPYDYEDPDNHIDTGLLVLEINGQSTKDIDEQEFYAILDKNQKRVELKVLAHSDKEPRIVILKGKETHIPDFANKPYIQNNLAIGLSGIKKDVDHGWYENNYERVIDKRNSSFKKTGTKCTELVDPDFDWFYVKTYDFAIVGDDPLSDRAILDKIAIPIGWKRDTENPDVIFTIAKDSHESISETYVPPTVRTINTGSKTTANYNVWTKSTEYKTQHNTQTIREGGYTHSTRTTDMFLEVSLLDAKRINDPKQQAAPIVWQATFNAHATNVSLNITDVYQAWVTWVKKYDVAFANTSYASAPLFYRLWACSSDGIVTHATTDSRLKVGDEIIKYRWYKGGKWKTQISESPEYGRKLLLEGDHIYEEFRNQSSVYEVHIRRAGKIIKLNNVKLITERYQDNTEIVKVRFWNVK